MFDQSNAESGAQIEQKCRKEIHTYQILELLTSLCPYCENLFDEVDLLTELILEAMEGYEATKIQIGARIPKDQIETRGQLKEEICCWRF